MPMIADRPIGPAPTIATTSPGRTLPLRTPTSYPVGRMSASIRICSSVHARGYGVGRGVGERNADVLGLGSVDLVTEDPTAAAEALAVAALAAVAARAARGDARDEYVVADFDVLHAGADRLDGADGLVTDDPPIGHRGDVTLQDVQVGAADGDRIDSDDGVGVVDDDRLRDFFPRLLAGTVVHDCAHRKLLCFGFSLEPKNSKGRADRAIGPSDPQDVRTYRIPTRPSMLGAVPRRIVILGGGTGGTLTANRLRRLYNVDDAVDHGRRPGRPPRLPARSAVRAVRV